MCSLLSDVRKDPQRRLARPLSPNDFDLAIDFFSKTSSHFAQAKNGSKRCPMPYILAIDQGTTSSRALLFDETMTLVGQAQEEFPQSYPQPGFVEHDPRDLWESCLRCCHKVLEQTWISAKDLAGIGLTNQRETTLVWDRNSGDPVHPALVWQDRRTAQICKKLHGEGHEDKIRDKTGLLLDPYFSATKLQWILNHVDGALQRAKRGDLLFGTVDSYLIWKLTAGRCHVTDVTNASRTMLFNIETGQWDQELCDLFEIPMTMLPHVLDCAAPFGHTDPSFLGQAAYSGGCRGSTSGSDGPGLFPAGYDQVNLWHRLFCPLEHRGPESFLAKSSFDHHCLSLGGQNSVCP